ncbi:MAG: transposase family protein [Symploca sp. SIO2E9]|nr:transposase family protein [Symploca sp. SIO2E9]
MKREKALAQVQDFRTPRGRCYPLRLILLLVIMATMSDCLGYNELALPLQGL